MFGLFTSLFTLFALSDGFLFAKLPSVGEKYGAFRQKENWRGVEKSDGTKVRRNTGAFWKRFVVWRRFQFGAPFYDCFEFFANVMKGL